MGHQLDFRSTTPGQPQTIGCTIATTSGMGCYPLVVGDPYAGSHDIAHFYNAAAFQNPAVATQIGQTDYFATGWLPDSR